MPLFPALGGQTVSRLLNRFTLQVLAGCLDEIPINSGLERGLAVFGPSTPRLGYVGNTLLCPTTPVTYILGSCP